jgi:hypothetical protein
MSDTITPVEPTGLTQLRRFDLGFEILRVVSH